MFEHLLVAVDHDFVRFITHVELTEPPPEETDEGLEKAVTNASEVAPGALGLPAHGKTASAVKALPKEGDKIGRNEPCWCGSGRKFKQCHGRP
jgi:preprotein translocase subunit SecA